MIVGASRLPEPAGGNAVGELLAEAGYREDRVCALLGAPSTLEAVRAGSLVLTHRTRGGSRLEVLVRLFLQCSEVSAGELSAALDPGSTALLDEAGLIEADLAGAWRSTVQVWPIRSLVIASDRTDRHGGRAADFVVPPAPGSSWLADVMIRRPARATLDLCCGSGLLGLLAAAHSDRVVGTDLNPRAVALARFNVALNRLERVESAEGDLFEPVIGQRFDLIVCNPPYVISPGATYLYRDGGSGICERIVREAPGHLDTGGCLQMLCNWPQGAGEDWRARVACWFEGTDCDAWVLRLHSIPAPAYAAMWLAQEGSVGADAFAVWMAHLGGLGIESVGGGLVVMRPAAGRRPWLELRDAPPIECTGAGESIARTFAARALAAGVPCGEALLDARLHPSPDLEQVTRARPTGEGWDRGDLELRLTRGLRFSARIDPVAAAVIGLLDGRRTVREALTQFAGSHGVPVEAFVGDLPRALAALLHLGLLLPADER